MTPSFYGENASDGHREVISVDLDSPDRIAARREPRHELDGDTDADFDYDDGANIDFQSIKSVPPDALKVLVRFLVPAEVKKNRWRQAQIRLAIVAHLVNLDGIGGLSFEKLAQELGCSRALLSLRSLEMLDGFSINKSRNGKGRHTRAVYSASATEAHRRAGHKMSEDTAKDAL